MLQVHRASTTRRIRRKCKFIVPCRTILLHRRRRNIARKIPRFSRSPSNTGTQTEKNGGTHGQQSGRISPVTPPRLAGIREAKTAEHTENRSSAQTKVGSFGHNTETKTATHSVAPNQSTQNVESVHKTSQTVELPHRISDMQSVRSNTAPQAKRSSVAVKPDISPVSPVKPTVQPPKAQTAPKNPISPVSQPRTLRRSAEPVKSNNITPQNGGERHAGRKHKP